MSVSYCRAIDLWTGVSVKQEKSKGKLEEVKPEGILLPSDNLEQVIPLVKPKRKYDHLRKCSIERGKETDKAILQVLDNWASKRTGQWGTLTNLQDGLELIGKKLTLRVIREHAIGLAKKKHICLERVILDPKQKYKPRQKLNGKYMYFYYVALHGDNGELGLVDFVINKFCDTYIERDEKGRFIDFY